MIPKQLQNLKFCRIRKGTKKPFEKDWTNKPHTYEEIKKFLPKENYGILCGYENLAVIDCDNEALQVAIQYLLPQTFRVKTKNGTHNYFIIPELKQKIILDSGDIHLGEVQSQGTQVVGPGSTHPKGGTYDVLNDAEVAEISCEKLLEVVSPFMKETKEIEENIEFERREHSGIDDLSVANIWGTAGLKQHGSEYYGSHPVHGSAGGMNFWINPLKNIWHCFRCNSGGGPLSAIAVKEGIIDCSDATRGNLRGSKAREAIEKAKDKYGLKEEVIELKKPQIEEEIKIIWAKDLKNYKEEEKEWIINRLLPLKAICILTGKRGTLKTFITLLLGYSVASGSSFLNKYETTKGKVIYLDKENGLSIMKKRVGMIERGLEVKDDYDVGFICFSQLKLDKLNDIVAMEKMINKHKPKLLIVDTYRRGVSFDENDAGKVSELFVDTLRPLVEKYNLSILLIHHNRKGHGEGDEMDELRGSSDLANYADVILKMERRGGNVVFKQLKNRNAEEEKPIKIKVEFSENSDSYVKITYEGEFMRQSKVDKCMEILTIWIAENDLNQFKTADAKKIAFKAGVKESTFKDALNEMENTGIIENIGFGLYEVIQ